MVKSKFSNSDTQSSALSPQHSVVTYKKIYQVVMQIPCGRVATYGQVAKLAGIPGQARQVGYALSASRDNHIPWHRVINARGEISPRSDSAFEHLQRELLEYEGVKFDNEGRISLHRYRWHTGNP